MIRRILLRISWYHAYQCKQCGYQVPTVGTRWDQMAAAVDHYEDMHEDEL